MSNNESKAEMPTMLWCLVQPKGNSDPCMFYLNIRHKFDKDKYEVKVSDDDISFSGTDVEGNNYAFEWKWRSAVNGDSVNAYTTSSSLWIEVQQKELGPFDRETRRWPEAMEWQYPFSNDEENKFEGYVKNQTIKWFDYLNT